jgi:hypothetical protein
MTSAKRSTTLPKSWRAVSNESSGRYREDKQDALREYVDEMEEEQND